MTMTEAQAFHLMAYALRVVGTTRYPHRVVSDDPHRLRSGHRTQFQLPTTLVYRPHLARHARDVRRWYAERSGRVTP